MTSSRHLYTSKPIVKPKALKLETHCLFIKWFIGWQATAPEGKQVIMTSSRHSFTPEPVVKPQEKYNIIQHVVQAVHAPIAYWATIYLNKKALLGPNYMQGTSTDKYVMFAQNIPRRECFLIHRLETRFKCLCTCSTEMNYSSRSKIRQGKNIFSKHSRFAQENHHTTYVQRIILVNSK